MEVDRALLLQRLLACQIGATPRENEQQSSCFILKAGWAYTLSREIACATPTGLDPKLTGAVEAKLLTQLLKLRSEQKVSIEVKNRKTLMLTGKNSGKSEIAFDSEIVLRVDRVERPGKDDYKPLDGQFATAVAMVQRCTRKKDEFSMACVHITPSFVEACDNRHAARYDLNTFVSEPSLVRASTLKEVIPLGFTKACQTRRWLHFRNPGGLRMSVRRHDAEDYPDISEFLARRGQPVKLPKGLKDASKRAGVVADADVEGKTVVVVMTSEQFTVFGTGVQGRHTEPRRHGEYDGPPVRFCLPAEMLAELTEQSGEVEIADRLLRVSDGPYTYITSLRQVEGEEYATESQSEQEDETNS